MLEIFRDQPRRGSTASRDRVGIRRAVITLVPHGGYDLLSRGSKAQIRHGFLFATCHVLENLVITLLTVYGMPPGVIQAMATDSHKFRLSHPVE